MINFANDKIKVLDQLTLMLPYTINSAIVYVIQLIIPTAIIFS